MSAPRRLRRDWPRPRRASGRWPRRVATRKSIIREARERANQIIDQAHHRANEIVEAAKGTANTEGARLVAAAHQQIELDTSQARESLRREVAGIAVGAASKLLGREIDARAHADLLDQLATQI